MDPPVSLPDYPNVVAQLRFARLPDRMATIVTTGHRLGWLTNLLTSGATRQALAHRDVTAVFLILRDTGVSQIRQMLRMEGRTVGSSKAVEMVSLQRWRLP